MAGIALLQSKVLTAAVKNSSGGKDVKYLLITAGMRHVQTIHHVGIPNMAIFVIVSMDSLDKIVKQTYEVVHLFLVRTMAYAVILPILPYLVVVPQIIPGNSARLDCVIAIRNHVKTMVLALS